MTSEELKESELHHKAKSKHLSGDVWKLEINTSNKDKECQNSGSNFTD